MSQPLTSLLRASLFGLALIACTHAGSGCTRGQIHSPRSRDAVRDILDQMVRDSRTYYVPEGLPGRQRLLSALAAETGEFWRKLTPLQTFFVFETAPHYLKEVPAATARDAYCAAMEKLPGDWWGTYARPNSETSARLMQIDGIDTCLLRELDSETPLELGDSESATLAAVGHFQVGDLAAQLLAARHRLTYDMRASLPDRKARRSELKKQIAAG